MIKHVMTRQDISDGIYRRAKHLREEYAPSLLAKGDYIKLKEVLASLESLENAAIHVKDMPDGEVAVDVLMSLLKQSFGLRGNFFVWDDENGMSILASAESAESHAEERMKKFENGWCDGHSWGAASTLCWGVCFGRTTSRDVTDKNGGDTEVFDLVRI